jgi:hypothetical protein
VACGVVVVVLYNIIVWVVFICYISLSWCPVLPLRPPRRRVCVRFIFLFACHSCLFVWLFDCHWLVVV